MMHEIPVHTGILTGCKPNAENIFQKGDPHTWSKNAVSLTLMKSDNSIFNQFKL